MEVTRCFIEIRKIVRLVCIDGNGPSLILTTGPIRQT